MYLIYTTAERNRVSQIKCLISAEVPVLFAARIFCDVELIYKCVHRKKARVLLLE